MAEQIVTRILSLKNNQGCVMLIKKSPRLLLSAIAITLAAQLLTTQAIASEIATANQLTWITDAEQISRINPKYPRRQEKTGQEGWTNMSYIIEPDGSVSNVVVQDSSGQQGFDSASIKAIEQWTFKPASENGQAIQQCRNSVKMTFEMSNSKRSVSRPFYRLYKEANAELEQLNLDAMREKIDELKALRQNRFSEITYLSLLEASYAEQKNDQPTWLKHLQDAVFAGKNTLPDDELFGYLKTIYLLQATQNKLSDALTTYNKLIKMKQAEPLIAPLQAHRKALEDLVYSDKDIILAANIKNSDLWHHELVRNQFSLVNIVGKLTKLDVRCANKRHVFTIDKNTTWDIPPTWQSCSVFVYGEKDSQFQLVEHPFKAP